MIDLFFYGAVGFLLAIVVWQLVLRIIDGRPFAAMVAVFAVFVVLMPGLALADDFSGAGPLIAAIASRLPQPYATWFVTVIAILGMLSMLSSWFRGAVRPPADTAPKWWIVAYRVLAMPAGDFGWARNVVLPGQSKGVQESMLLVAKFVSTNPGADGRAIADAAKRLS